MYVVHHKKHSHRFIFTLLQQRGAIHTDSSGTSSGHLCVVLPRCDLTQTLQGEVSWWWCSPSISLMDWKRFTRKSNKRGRRSWRTATHKHTLTSWKLALLPRLPNKTACLCTGATTALRRMTRRTLFKWAQMQTHGVDVLWPGAFDVESFLSFFQRLKVWLRKRR